MNNQQNQVITEFFSAISDYDAERLAALFSDKASLLMAGRPVFHGPEGAKKLVHQLSAHHTAWAMQARRVIAQDNTAAVEWTTTLTDFGGGQGRVDGCAVFDFTGDRIDQVRIYWRPEDLGD